MRTVSGKSKYDHAHAAPTGVSNLMTPVTRLHRTRPQRIIARVYRALGVSGPWGTRGLYARRLAAYVLWLDGMRSRDVAAALGVSPSAAESASGMVRRELRSNRGLRTDLYEVARRLG